MSPVDLGIFFFFLNHTIPCWFPTTEPCFSSYFKTETGVLPHGILQMHSLKPSEVKLPSHRHGASVYLALQGTVKNTY